MSYAQSSYDLTLSPSFTNSVKILQECQAGLAAFFRVKLCAVYVFLLHRSRQIKAIVGKCGLGLGVGDIGIERVCEIEMFFTSKAGKQIHIFGQPYQIPAHMWDCSP